MQTLLNELIDRSNDLAATKMDAGDETAAECYSHNVMLLESIAKKAKNV